MGLLDKIFLWMVSLAECNPVLGGVIITLILVTVAVMSFLLIVLIGNWISPYKVWKGGTKDIENKQTRAINSKSPKHKKAVSNNGYNRNNQQNTLGIDVPLSPPPRKRPVQPKSIPPQPQPPNYIGKETLPLSSSTAGVVDYNVYFLDYFTESDNVYPKLLLPQGQCVVYPYRKYKSNLRGYKEIEFENALRLHLLGTYFRVLGDACLCLAEDTRPYEPDIAVIDTKSSIRIDIEIDEPYAGISRKPCHYIGCGDEYRDKNLLAHGWIVLRFSERQVHESLQECLCFVSTLISKLKGKTDILRFDDTEDAWTLLQAQQYEKAFYREMYLGIEKFDSQVMYAISKVSQLTEEEHKAKEKVPPFFPTLREEEQKAVGYNSLHSNNRDKNLSFEPISHTYLYKGISLTAVSTLVSSIFPEFDKEYWGQVKANQAGITKIAMLETWDCKGAMSREVGTFLHEQIERIFLKEPIKYNYHFKYAGKKIQQDEIVSIATELKYFQELLKDPVFSNSQIYRTEWRVYDEEFGIAGTIDCLLKTQSGKYIIIDWKRSEKIGNAIGDKFYPQTTNGYQSGCGKLSHIDDTSYNRYILQQNLYAYILQKHYAIKVSEMYLAVISPKYNKAYLVPVPFWDKETKSLLAEV